MKGSQIPLVFCKNIYIYFWWLFSFRFTKPNGDSSCKIYLSKLLIIFVWVMECIRLIPHCHMIYLCTPPILVLPTMSIWDFNLNGSTNKRLVEPPSSMNFQNFRYLAFSSRQIISPAVPCGAINGPITKYCITKMHWHWSVESYEYCITTSLQASKLR